MNKIQTQESWNVILALFSLLRDSFYKWHCRLYLSLLLFFSCIAYGAEHDLIPEYAVKTIRQIGLSDNCTFHDSQTLRERRINQSLNILIDGNDAKVRYDLTAYERTAVMGQSNEVMLFSECKEFLVNVSNMVKIINENVYTNSSDYANGDWNVYMLVVHKETNRKATLTDYSLDVTTSIAKIFRLLLGASGSAPVSGQRKLHHIGHRKVHHPEGGCTLVRCGR